MAEEIDRLRVLTNEDPEDSDFTDGDLALILAQNAGKQNRAAAAVWRVKAGQYADLVNISEGNSSRAWSGAYKQALEMAEKYDALADAEDGGSSSGTITARSRKIVRS